MQDGNRHVPGQAATGVCVVSGASSRPSRIMSEDINVGNKDWSQSESGRSACTQTRGSVYAKIPVHIQGKWVHWQLVAPPRSSSGSLGLPCEQCTYRGQLGSDMQTVHVGIEEVSAKACEEWTKK